MSHQTALDNVLKLRTDLDALADSTKEDKEGVEVVGENAKKLLRGLGKCCVTIPILKETMVAKTVKRWKHNPVAGPTARLVLKHWRDFVRKLQEEEEAGKTTSSTTTKVCNVKVKFIRPHYDNLREWVKDSALNEYIGRKGVVFVDGQRFPPRDSPWANPFRITQNSTRADVVNRYEAHLRKQLKNDPTLKGELLKLDGKCLGCWCCPEACHGDVLVRAIQEIKQGKGGW
ncbi:expressed unknown protein [Seminavis robusta]|uniref:DUF4326 domain-containing protein n=1 Tax=Seminavis robusta TaxID=568900 RepID=A0A9N8H3C6_9STRA|nr:expressed unknown protein [Seminavis robusta]|eukprot:Sro24_g016240.1 n/a (230) ;mRNA; f:13995-14684